MSNMKNILTDKQGIGISTVLNNDIIDVSWTLDNVDNDVEIELLTCLWGSEELPSKLLGAYYMTGIRALQKDFNDSLRYKIKINTHATSHLNHINLDQWLEVADFTKRLSENILETFFSDIADKISIEIDTQEEIYDALDQIDTFDSKKVFNMLEDSQQTQLLHRAKKFSQWDVDVLLRYGMIHPLYEGLFWQANIVKIGWRPEALYTAISKSLSQCYPHFIDSNSYKWVLITKSGKSPLYYPYHWENDFYSRKNIWVNDIKMQFWYRDFDAKLIDGDIGLWDYLDCVNDFYLRNTM